MIIDEIIDHSSSEDAIPKTKRNFSTQHGTEVTKRTKRGWDLYVKWKDSSRNSVSI